MADTKRTREKKKKEKSHEGNEHTNAFAVAAIPALRNGTTSRRAVFEQQQTMIQRNSTKIMRGFPKPSALTKWRGWDLDAQ